MHTRSFRLFFLGGMIVSSLFPVFHVHAQGAGDTDLRSIMGGAYRSDPALMAARQELEATRELYPQARAGYFPTLSAGADIFRTNIDTSNFAGASGATTKEMTLSAEQPLWRGGRTSAEVERAQAFIRAGELTLLREEQALLFDVARVYLDVLREKALYALRLKNADILQQEFEAAQERHHLGDITITDVHQARARLARAQAALERARSDLDIRLAEFKDITGIDAPEKLDNPADITLDIPGSLADMIALAEHNNFDLLIAQQEKEAAAHNIDVAISDRLPEISAYASLNQQYDPQPGIIDRSRTDTIGVRASVALYQGGAVMSRIREARADLKRSEYTLEDIQRDIRKTVISHYKAYVSTKEQITAREEEALAAREALEGVRAEALSGQRTLLDILDADQDVVEAEIALVSARRDSVLAWYALATTLGLFNAERIGLL